MGDFYSRHIIEALRSGIPSRTVGEYFAEARPEMTDRIRGRLEKIREGAGSSGMIFTGRYGEGKTHMLNMLFNFAAQSNMVVSTVAIGKETPVDKLDQLYKKIVASTYLPGSVQPGFRNKIEELSAGNRIMGELLAYTARELETDKLYHLLKALIGTSDDEERYTLLMDIEGDFTTNAFVKKIYRRVTGTPARFNVNFSKTKHAMDYYRFLSHLFKALGYDGWVILFDEAELMGRFGKKARIKGYERIRQFMDPDPMLESVFSVFAFSSSYVEDVIDRRNETALAAELCADAPDSLKAVNATIDSIINAPELVPLSKNEVYRIMEGIQQLHGRAYDWSPKVSTETVYKATEAGGYLLRTKIRAAIEFFDQLYQYGEAGRTRITELGEQILDEENVPELTDTDDL